ncbi:tetratricopeptide repeat protein [Rhizobiales bacterium]|uniref:tetratricopeptide repeat protein n=1 Tax=Hongsoonwoonella zoysiae TaxID=2821844 RepID=UPI00156191C2|nr:tetratricopeptide repeat protein [Hongsoonwoonella zoysiae]NRG16128.1 tetratricopeptide repeat protein [Hongsoonwoonella zoysiae]
MTVHPQISPHFAKKPRARRSTVALPVVLAVAAAVSLAGCASSRKAVGTHAPSTQGYVAPGSDAARQSVQYWARAYQKDPKDRDNILNYAASLRRNGQIEQAEAVLRRAVIADHENRDISAAYGKVLAEAGKLSEALNVVRNAQTPTSPDWRLLSAEAAILDQMGEANEARDIYRQALKIAPDEPTLLNNLGLSYLLAGELPKAEETLRKAAGNPNADSRIRQNLALALGLQGKFEEAEQVASAEIDPAQANANIAYLKGMLAQRNSWAEIKSVDGNKDG